jgi:hypothetical protein
MPSPSNAFALLQAPSKKKNQLPGNDALLKSLMAANKKPVTAYEEKPLPLHCWIKNQYPEE